MVMVLKAREAVGVVRGQDLSGGATTAGLWPRWAPSHPILGSWDASAGRAVKSGTAALHTRPFTA